MTAKTPAERQRDLRARRRAEQRKEVRGIYAHPDDHAAVRQFAAMLQAQRNRRDDGKQ